MSSFRNFKTALCAVFNSAWINSNYFGAKDSEKLFSSLGKRSNSVIQCVAECCTVLQRVAVTFRVWQCVPEHLYLYTLIRINTCTHTHTHANTYKHTHNPVPRLSIICPFIGDLPLSAYTRTHTLKHIHTPGPSLSSICPSVGDPTL